MTMDVLAFVIGVLGLVSSVAATGPVPVTRSGLAGIQGFYFYNPYCGHGCFRSFSPFELQCSTTISEGGHTTSATSAHDLAVCRASDFPYLSSIAWCMHQFCPASVRASTIEEFWETEITGDVSILPKWSYGEVLANISTPPTMVSNASDMMMVLNETMLTTEANFQATWITLYYFFRETAQESYYGLAICLTSFGLPLLLTWLQYPRSMYGFVQNIRPYLVWPSTIGTYHDRPLPYLIGNAPTVGQGFYIAVVIILNIIFLCIGYATAWPQQENQWYKNKYQELMAYWMWRTGVLAFCQMPVLFLFSSRNNILLWLTNWSHSTYMVLHRWIARSFLLQTLLHSILALVLYTNTGSYSTSLKTGWWIWGCVATVAAVIIVLTSFLVIRQQAYELFLVTHVIMAVIVVVGCWYHVYIGYENTFGYETWLYATIAVWFFDRLVRVARIIDTGIRYAKVTEVGATIVRIDIPRIRWAEPGRCVYVYFPSLSPFKPWENHPFSTIPTELLSRHRDSDGSVERFKDLEKSDPVTIAPVASDTAIDSRTYTNSGLTLFVRKSTGTTRYLREAKRMPVLLEGPYPTNPTKAVLRSDRLLLVGGGIGITGLMPFVDRHPNIKLMYGVKAEDQCLVDALSGVLEDISEKDIVVGQRLELEAMLRAEAEMGWSKIAVIVCGPASMCDDVRSIVSKLGREKSGECSFELEIDAFSR
ncbi:hypothetical protein PRZ48_007374 [Zasmidium cellare]|uniref:FAD-binding FR-type domain-containing protein n=1 Tax=Zasmidium cellare TaxID=395010 RepID=A0ABR0EJY6_ZASCE|nr:hypothetical protein PRZ48_007374 [Zasmidium cellare]